MIKRLAHLLLCCLMACCALLQASANAAEAEVTTARIESTEAGYRLVTGFSFELSSTLEEAITHGIPMYFTTEVELTRPRWYWFDEKAAKSSQTVKIGYNTWTRQYTAAINNVQQNYSSLEEALAWVKQPPRWQVADKGALSAGAVYNVAVRLKLDINQLPKPIQINSLNNSDWRLSTDWKRFTFKADEK
jgi:hypothetical protein